MEPWLRSPKNEARSTSFRREERNRSRPWPYVWPSKALNPTAYTMTGTSIRSSSSSGTFHCQPLLPFGAVSGMKRPPPPMTSPRRALTRSSAASSKRRWAWTECQRAGPVSWPNASRTLSGSSLSPALPCRSM